MTLHEARIDLTRMECKVFTVLYSATGKNCIDLTRMECKVFILIFI